LPFALPSSGGPHGTHHTTHKKTFLTHHVEQFRNMSLNSVGSGIWSGLVETEFFFFFFLTSGRDRVAPLKPDEVEFLLGFPKDQYQGNQQD
jgi:hypothetical protein